MTTESPGPPMGDLDAERIAGALRGHVVGSLVSVATSTGSTMDAARGMAEAGAPDGTVVIADHQSHGRGRMGRDWIAPPGTSLLLSVAFVPDLAPDRWPLLSIAGGLSVLLALEPHLPPGTRASLKWPNDVLLNDRKVAGILSEAVVAPGRRDERREGIVVVGIGINVGQDAEGLPPHATSLAAVGAVRPRRDDLALELLLHLDEWYARLGDGESPVPAWSHRLATLGRNVRAVSPSVTTIGMAVGVDASGGLVVETSGGKRVTLLAGDVTLL